MFIMGVGGPLGAELLRQLEPDEIRRISAEIYGRPRAGADSRRTGRAATGYDRHQPRRRR